MAEAIAHVIAAGANALAPVFVTPFLRQLDVGAAQADALAVDAREIRLAADACAEADVERVIPDVQFPRVRRIDHRHEIDRRHRLAVRPGQLVGDIDDVFIRADAAEGRDDVIGKLVGRGRQVDRLWAEALRIILRDRLQTPAGMRGPDERALGLGPAQGVEPERRPMVLGRRRRDTFDRASAAGTDARSGASRSR